MKKYVYSMDAGALITAHRHRYPIDVFPAFWDKTAQLAGCGKMFLCDETFGEILKGKGKGDALYQWAQKIREAHPAFVKVTGAEELAALGEISRRFPQLPKNKAGKPADSTIVAHAQTTNTTVITEEKPSGGDEARKIPDVCGALKVECINLLEMMRREKWTF